MNGNIKLTYPDAIVSYDAGSGFTSTADYSKNKVFEAAADDCEKQADARIFNYRCLLKFWASHAQTWSDYGVHFTVSLANDYYEIVNWLSKQQGDDGILSEIKGACPSCSWTVAPFTVTMYPGQIPKLGPDPTPGQAEKEVGFLRSLDFIGTNPGMVVACVDDLSYGNHCANVTRVPNDELFGRFGETTSLYTSNCQLFDTCYSIQTPVPGPGGDPVYKTFKEQTGVGGCFCQNDFLANDGTKCVNYTPNDVEFNLVAECSDRDCTPAFCGSFGRTNELCYGDWNYCQGPGRSLDPQKLLDPPFAYLHANLSSAFYNSWALRDRLLPKLNEIPKSPPGPDKFVLMGISMPFYELGVYSTFSFTKTRDHQEQIDYVEAMISGLFEEYDHVESSDIEPWDFARVWNLAKTVCNGECESRRLYVLSGIKSNFDDLTYLPMDKRNESVFCQGSCRSYWQKPYAEYLKLLFGN
ncbi:MAG: hypothetical protein HY897_21820 [Deltaproteobacteria bacterium]|nr:hypothetical protein [Deltaproteobacteria bacterium]